MGRKRSFGNIQDALIIKNKHRYADTKYRQNIQYLHDLLKDRFNVQSTKNSLLNTVLANIVQMENDIVNICDSQTLSDYKHEFSKLYQLEENIWKKEKDTCKWWDKVQGMIKGLLEKNMNASQVLEMFSNYLDDNNSSSLITIGTIPTQSRIKGSSNRGHKRSQNHFPNISDVMYNNKEEFYDISEEPPEKYFHSEYLLNNPGWNG